MMQYNPKDIQYFCQACIISPTKEDDLTVVKHSIQQVDYCQPCPRCGKMPNWNAVVNELDIKMNMNGGFEPRLSYAVEIFTMGVNARHQSCRKM